MAIPSRRFLLALGACLLPLAAEVSAQGTSPAATASANQPLTQEQMQDELAEQRVLKEAEERRELERESDRNPLAITAYRRNYLLPWSYNAKPDEASFREINDEAGIDHAEVKFQFSAKFNLVDDLFGNNGDLYFAYTQRSWWQAYNSEASAPFRETNFEPEVFVSFDNDWSFLGWTNIKNRIAFNHQSNGRSDPLSRSWNRVYLDSIFQNGDWAVSIAPHWRIPESEGDDDNPDIERFMGYGDITVAKRLFDDHEASLLVRGNPSAGNMGSQFDYSVPLLGNLRAHLQYYYGYGESLVDYNHRNNRVSLGFSLTPFFSGRR